MSEQVKHSVYFEMEGEEYNEAVYIVGDNSVRVDDRYYSLNTFNCMRMIVATSIKTTGQTVD